jgi:hypothetical protein
VNFSFDDKNSQIGLKSLKCSLRFKDVITVLGVSNQSGVKKTLLWKLGGNLLFLV